VDVRERLKNATGFQWDGGNLEKNAGSHRAEFWESEEIFFNQPFVVLPDGKHSTIEERYYGLGKTDLGRALLVVFRLRGDEVRIISARDMSRKERTVFDQNEESQKSSEVQD
jgi:uncharacterized protein